LLERSRSNQLEVQCRSLHGALLIVCLASSPPSSWPTAAEAGRAAGRRRRADRRGRFHRAGADHRRSDDEIATLGTAFNRMTGQLQEQTGALMAANQQLDTRRAFIEAVLSSVTAGVIALDGPGGSCSPTARRTRCCSRAKRSVEAKELADVSPELGEFLRGETRDANVLVTWPMASVRWRSKRMRYADGSVLTFDDITDQLSDQRRAAWSDIARRIAHEIKNPLTPIQLAAERLQRRYSADVASDPETFTPPDRHHYPPGGRPQAMVDEFSNFARMPKPVFRDENVHDIARAGAVPARGGTSGDQLPLDPPPANSDWSATGGSSARR
jgi:two-component system nitrogen regulation sensor histidine kinase NtrY